MNSRGRINCLAKVVWRVVHSRLQRPRVPDKVAPAAAVGVSFTHGRRLLLHCAALAVPVCARTSPASVW
jgi:hypothetical protein